MTIFWVGSAILLLLTAAIVFWPYFRYAQDRNRPQSTEVSDSRLAENVALYLEHKSELDREYDDGRLDKSQYDKLIIEIKRNLLSDSWGQSAGHSGAQSRLLMPVAFIALVLGSSFMYFQRGSSGDLLFTKLQQQVTAHNLEALQKGEQPDVEPTKKLIANLKERVKARPDNPQYWYLLGRYSSQVGDFKEAERGFRGAYQLAPEDATLASELAQALFFVNGNRIDEETRFLLERALSLNPEDTTALGLAGIGAFERQDFAKALQYWQRAVDLTPTFAPGRRALEAGITRVQAELDNTAKGAAEGRSAEASRKQKTQNSTDNVSSSIRIPVEVVLSDDLPLPEGAYLFVFAREYGASPMPLLVKRTSATERTMSIILDETMAMTTNERIGQVEQLELVARISLTGQASPQAGDMEGRSSPISLGDIDGSITIVIDKLL